MIPVFILFPIFLFWLPFERGAGEGAQLLWNSPWTESLEFCALPAERNPAKGFSHIRENFSFKWALLTLVVFWLVLSLKLTKHMTDFSQSGFQKDPGGRRLRWDLAGRRAAPVKPACSSYSALSHFNTHPVATLKTFHPIKKDVVQNKRYQVVPRCTWEG